MKNLAEAVTEFMRLESAALSDEAAIYHRVVAGIHHLCAAVRDAETRGASREEIQVVLAPARALHAASPFVHRLQTWPRGYPGDYETIEYLCDCVTLAPRDSIAYYIEHHSLRDISAQQHRNKVAWQARCILDTALRLPNARILSLACGGSRDLRSIEALLADRPLTIFLNDMDAGAIEHSLHHLPALAASLQTIPGDVFTAARKFRTLAPLHLILAGGLFDYLNERQITWLLPKLFATLAPEGRICFTNLAPGNPDRVWLEHIADWRILERSEADIYHLVAESGLAAVSSVRITRDATGLTQLIELTKTNVA